MRHARWTAPLLGLVMVTALVTPAGAGTPAASTTDTKILNVGVIAARDVPATWTASTQAPVTDFVKKLKAVPACKSIAAATATAQRTAPYKISSTYTDPNSAQKTTNAQNQVYAFASKTGASTFLTAYKGGATTGCLHDLVVKNVPSAQATVQAITNLKGVGDANAGYQETIKVPDALGNTETVIVDEVIVRVGRAVTSFDFENTGQPISQGPAIISAVVARLRPVARA